MRPASALPFLLVASLTACSSSEESPRTETDSGVVIDADTDSASAEDTAIRDTSGAEDTAILDTSGAGDTAILDTSTDTSSPDTSIGDSLSDSSPGDTAGDVSDAADTKICGCSETCGPTSGDVVQIDASSVLIHDVVRNTGDTTQDAMDGAGFSLMTAGYASTRSAVGLPNDGYFAPTTVLPWVSLPIGESNNGPNARVLSTDGEGFALTIAPRFFTRLFFWVTSTGGSDVGANVTFTYCDGTSSTKFFVTPDWLTDPAPAGARYRIDNLSRYSVVDSSVTEVDAAIWGMEVNPTATKRVSSIQLYRSAGGTGSRLVFFGATGTN